MQANLLKSYCLYGIGGLGHIGFVGVLLCRNCRYLFASYDYTYRADDCCSTGFGKLAAKEAVLIVPNPLVFQPCLRQSPYKRLCCLHGILRLASVWRWTAMPVPCSCRQPCFSRPYGFGWLYSIRPANIYGVEFLPCC